ncbi:MAG: hypothetical protein K1X28_06780 [Parachlamydiales bacterium]|nr:hypothetical protein [Parachlamydiales bacterium]
MPKVTFATSCWERDWRTILLDPEYLSKRQIGNHLYPFCEKILIINNVEDLGLVERIAQGKVDEGLLTRYVVARDVLESFGLKRSDFNEWQYYNALAPLMAIYEARGDYLLYLTGDVSLKKPVDWIDKAIRFMEKRPAVKVANLTWNDNYREARKESYRSTWNFYVAKEGFSDQMFLVNTDEFKRPIYGEIRADGAHYPRGDVFEKRIFSYMKNRGWERITYKRGSYVHEDANFFRPQSSGPKS